MTNSYTPKSAMAIFAHPDDIEYTCAATMARWAREGARIAYVLCTSGDVGIDKPGMTRLKAAEIREAESRAAAEITGVQDITFLGEPDGLLVASIALRKKLVREIRRFKPEVIVCGDPTAVWGGDDYINHPDHRAAALAAIDAAFPASGQPNLFEELEEEGLKAHKIRKVYVGTWGNGNTWVNVDDTIEIKAKALLAHKSQMGDYDPTDMIKEWAASAAKGKEMSFAETYKVVTLMNDEDWQKYIGKNGA